MRGAYWITGTILRTDSLRTDDALIFITPSFEAISVSIFNPRSILTAWTVTDKRPIGATPQKVSDLVTCVQAHEYKRVWYTIKIHRGPPQSSFLTIKACLEAPWLTLIKNFGTFFVNCMLIRMGKRTYCACSANDSRYCWGETLFLTPPVQTENKCALFQCCGTRMLRAIRRHSTGDQEVIELFWNVQTYEWTLYENGRWRHQSINPCEPWEDPVNQVKATSHRVLTEKISAVSMLCSRSSFFKRHIRKNE